VGKVETEKKEEGERVNGKLPEEEKERNRKKKIDYHFSSFHLSPFSPSFFFLMAELLFSLNNATKVNSDPAGHVDLAYSYTEAYRPDKYNFQFNSNNMHSTEGAIVWKDNHIQESSNEGVSLTLSMVNEILKRETKNRVAGLCNFNLGVFRVLPDVAVTKDTGVANEHIFTIPFDYGNPGLRPPFPSRKNQDLIEEPWPANKLISYQDVRKRISPRGVFNTTRSALPTPGETVGIRDSGIHRLVDVWEPYLSSQESEKNKLLRKDFLQFSVTVETETTPANPSIPTSREVSNVFYQIVPTINHRTPKKTTIFWYEGTPTAKHTGYITDPSNFWTMGYVHDPKNLKSYKTTLKHQFQLINNNVRILQDFMQDSHVNAVLKSNF
jgi:hypothetical protein